MTVDRVLALVGFMGSGKSTVGRALAERLGRPYVDLDESLEQASGRTIRAWFESAGEAAFRVAERAELAAVLARLAPAGGVVAVGGGAFAEEETRDVLAAHARTIWLEVPLAEIRSRIVDDGARPLYRDPANVARLFAARRAAYAQAELRIDAAGSPTDVVERILAALAEAGSRGGGG